jgi:hypothetical protein
MFFFTTEDTEGTEETKPAAKFLGFLGNCQLQF